MLKRHGVGEGESELGAEFRVSLVISYRLELSFKSFPEDFQCCCSLKLEFECWGHDTICEGHGLCIFSAPFFLAFSFLVWSRAALVNVVLPVLTKEVVIGFDAPS